MKQEISENEATSDFWQHHSVRFLEMAFNHDYREVVNHPDGYGRKTGVCGDTVEMFLTERPESIPFITLSFNIDGCINTAACCNAVIHLLKDRIGKDEYVEAAWDITPEEVISYLETLPEDHHHCAELAVGALYLCLADYRRKKSTKWKQLYRIR